MANWRKYAFAFPLCLLLSLLDVVFFSKSSLAQQISLGSFDLGNTLGLSPFLDWKQIESTHFKVYYPAELQPVAQKAIQHFEDAHRLLSPLLQWEPRYQVPVLLVNNQDSANGMTSPFGRFGIFLITTPPENWLSTYYYDDWLRSLIIHEYTHFLNMDPTRGPVWNGLRVLFGDVLLPNGLLPNWMLEGLAVYLETRMTEGGRGRSPYYDMILRTMVRDHALNRPHHSRTLDQLTGDVPSFPGGESSYFFGYFLTQKLVQSKDLPALGELSIRSAGRVPFFINGNLENVIQKDWHLLWKEWTEDAQKQMQEELKTLHQSPLSSATLESESKFSAWGAVLSPDKKTLAWTQDSIDRRYGLSIKHLQSGQIERIDDKLLGVGLAFSPDSQWLIGSRLQRKRQYSLLSELVAYHLPSRKVIALLDSERIKDPHLSARGDQIVYVRVTDQAQQIVLADWITSDPPRVENPRVLYSRPLWDALHQPRFTPDQSRIVFSQHLNGQRQEDLMSIELASQTIQPLVADGFFNRHATFAPDGRLFFVSDRTGVDTVYQYRKGQSPLPILHTDSGIWFPHWGNEGLYASLFTLRGWEIAYFPQSSFFREHGSLPSIRPLQENHHPEKPLPPTSTLTSPLSEEAPYSIFPSIWPRQWAPLFLGTSQGVFGGGQVLGFDALDRHRYFLSAAYFSYTRQADWNFSYVNRSFGPQIGLQTQSYFLGNSAQAENGFLRNETHGLSVTHPFLGTWSAVRATVGVSWQRDVLSTRLPEVKVLRSPHFSPRVDTLVSYSDLETSRLAVGAERGQSVQAGLRSIGAGSSVVFQPYLSAQKFFPILGTHTILNPALYWTWSSRTETDWDDTRVRVVGKATQLVNPYTSAGLNGIPLRGYTGNVFLARSAGVGSMNLRFPIWRIFRGWGTYPFFLENLYGVSFFEGAYFPDREPGSGWLPAAGAGIRWDAQLWIRVPVTLALEYHHGLRKNAGGGPEVFVALSLTGLSL